MLVDIIENLKPVDITLLFDYEKAMIEAINEINEELQKRRRLAEQARMRLL